MPRAMQCNWHEQFVNVQKVIQLTLNNFFDQLPI